MTTETTACDIFADLPGRISSVVDCAEAVSLVLLSQIEKTVDALAAKEKLAEGVAEAFGVLANEIKNTDGTVGRVLDSDDTIIDSLASSCSVLEKHLLTMMRKKDAINCDHRLRSDHRDTLHNSYERSVNALNEMIEATKTLRAAIIAHDLRAEPAPAETFSNVGDLFSSLKR